MAEKPTHWRFTVTGWLAMLRYLSASLGLMLLALAALIAMFLLLVMPAGAQPTTLYDPRNVFGYDDRAAERWYGYGLTYYHYPQRAVRLTRVKSRYYRDDDDYDRDERHCKARITVVGIQHVTIDGARDAADKAWIQSARWYHGERYMDIGNAKGGPHYECSRSSVGEIMGGTFNRCEVSARPCRAQTQ